MFARPLLHTNEGVLSLNSSNPAPVASPATPTAARLETASWINLRSVLGLVLVFGAVFAGTVVLQRAQHLVQVRLPAAELGRYLRPDNGTSVTGKMLTAPLRQHMLVPADGLVASGEQAGMVELAINVDPGDMLQGLRPGDHVQILGAYSDGVRQGAAQVLVDSAEVVRILEESGGLATGHRESGVQVRLSGERSASVAAAIAGGRVFIVKAPSLPSRPAVQGGAEDDQAPIGSSEPEPSEGSP